MNDITAEPVSTGTPELPQADKPASNESGGDAFRDAMANIYDKSLARDERQARDDPPLPFKEGRDPRETMEAAWDWQETPRAERQRTAKAISAKDEMQAEADRLGITFDQALMLRQTEALSNPPVPERWNAAADSMRSLFPEQQPEDTANWLADVVKYARRDPPGALRWMAQQLGVDPASALAPPDPNQAVNEFLGANAEAAEYIEDMLTAITTGKVKRDRDPRKTLQAAFKHVRRPTTHREEMERIYDRAQA
jgi:hypothetical protein